MAAAVGADGLHGAHAAATGLQPAFPVQSPQHAPPPDAGQHLQAQHLQQAPPPAAQPPQQPQPVHLSSSQLCRMGQEAVQDIVNKTMELFKQLAVCQPPNGTVVNMQFQAERKRRIHEALDLVGAHFRRLRKICEKVNEGTTDMEFVQIESLIPLREPGDVRPLEDKKKNSEIVRKLTEERALYSEQLRIRNRKLKEIIDMLRDIVWDINTMLAMRKP